MDEKDEGFEELDKEVEDTYNIRGGGTSPTRPGRNRMISNTASDNMSSS